MAFQETRKEKTKGKKGTNDLKVETVFLLIKESTLRSLMLFRGIPNYFKVREVLGFPGRQFLYESSYLKIKYSNHLMIPLIYKPCVLAVTP